MVLLEESAIERSGRRHFVRTDVVSESFTRVVRCDCLSKRTAIQLLYTSTTLCLPLPHHLPTSARLALLLLYFHSLSS